MHLKYIMVSHPNRQPWSSYSSTERNPEVEKSFLQLLKKLQVLSLLVTPNTENQAYLCITHANEGWR